MKHKKYKVAIIGCGAVGMSCIYAIMNQNLASDYVLIDINQAVTKGNAADLADCATLMQRNFNSVIAGKYNDLADCDLLIISAGKPPQKGKSRLEEMNFNTKIMKDIAQKVRNSGFKGLTLIVSNPVDVMTALYQKITEFPIARVFGSGTQLDTARLELKIATMLSVSSGDVKSYIIGEHGDSAVPLWSMTKIKRKPLLKYLKHVKQDAKILPTWHKQQMKDVFDIVKNKGNTCYAIGASVAKLVHSIVNDAKAPLVISIFYVPEVAVEKVPGIYISQLARLNSQGWSVVEKIEYSDSEKTAFAKSVNLITDLVKNYY